MKYNRGFMGTMVFFIAIGAMVLFAIWYYQKQGFDFFNQPEGFAIVSPKAGAKLTNGRKYFVTLSEGLLSSYHPLIHFYSVVDGQNKNVGMICPIEEMPKGDTNFAWVAGNLYTSCAGSSNDFVEMPAGEYKILFTELDINTGDRARSAESGWFTIQ